MLTHNLFHTHISVLQSVMMGRLDGETHSLSSSSGTFKTSALPWSQGQVGFIQEPSPPPCCLQAELKLG